MCFQWFRLFSCGILATVSFCLLLHNTATAANKIVIKNGILRESVSVTELSTFAKTGKLSSSLKIYLTLARQNPKVVRQFLITPIKVNPLFLDKALNNFVGNLILDKLSTVVHTRSRKADRQALRSALVLSASDDKKITLMEVIENYPTSEVEIDGKQIRNVYHQLQQLQTDAGKYI